MRRYAAAAQKQKQSAGRCDGRYRMQFFVRDQLDALLTRYGTKSWHPALASILDRAAIQAARTRVLRVLGHLAKS